MRNTPIAEERSDDHFHLSAHWTIPHVAMENVPVLTITTQRCCNRNVVAAGPLLAVADLDMPMPMPGKPLDEFARHLMARAAVCLVENQNGIVYGTKGRKLKPELMPHPVALPEPLW